MDSLDEVGRKAIARALVARAAAGQRRDADFAKIAAAFAAEHPEPAQPPAETVGEAAERGMREAAEALARRWQQDDARLAEDRAAGREAHERARRGQQPPAGRGLLPLTAGSALAGARGSWLL